MRQKGSRAVKWLRTTQKQTFHRAIDEPRVGSRFTSLQSKDPFVRMTGLEEFLTFALGPRQAAFGESEAVLDGRRIPIPLRLFYGFAGRWPSPYPERAPVIFETPEEGFFYSGVEGPHMATPDLLRESQDGRLAIFSEQSGNWTAFADTDGDDPEVWLSGYVENDHLKMPAPTGVSLSGWLVTHCLVALVWELANHLCSGTAPSRIGAVTQRNGDTGLTEWFLRESRHSQLLWDAKENPCPELRGSFYLFRNSILVHDYGDSLRFAALTSGAMSEMHQHALRPQDLE